MNIEKYQQAAHTLVRNPDDAQALVELYGCICEKREYSKIIIPVARRAYEVAPNSVAAVFNYGTALHRAGYYDASLRMYQAALKIPGDEWKAKIWHHIGIAMRSMGRNREAFEAYGEAYKREPNPNMLKDQALAVLAQGRYLEGMELYEVRREAAVWKVHMAGGHLIAQAQLPADVEHWEGESLQGKEVVVYHEEGSGDFFQFCRYIPFLRALGASKVKLCGPSDGPLQLVADNLQIDEIVPLEGPFETDYVIGSMSLPWRCHRALGLGSLKIDGSSYLDADPYPLPRRPGFKVGLVWRGNPAYGQDALRSMPFQEYFALLDLPGVCFYSMQIGPGNLDPTIFGVDGLVANLTPLMPDWRATASMVTAMDAIVSVDTATAHLAGALGKPVFTMITASNDWRWPREGEKTPWYDSMRIIRQDKQDDWTSCVSRVRRAIERLANKRLKAA